MFFTQHPLSSVEKQVLEAVNDLVNAGTAFVSQEDMFAKTTIPIYTAFKIMNELKSKGFLDRYGWNFTTSNKGKKYLHDFGQFARQVKEIKWTR